MTHGSIARRYAGVVFEIAQTRGEADRALSELTAWRDLVATHAELRHVFEAPVVSAQKKKQIVDAVLTQGGGVSDAVKRLLMLLAERDRLSLVGAVVTALSERVMAAKHVSTADVVTAVPLSAEARTALTAALGKAVGTSITMHERVDPSIVGGVVARVGSLVFDGSVARQIQRLREQLVAD